MLSKTFQVQLLDQIHFLFYAALYNNSCFLPSLLKIKTRNFRIT